ncbi:MAG: hypothetical protein SW833_12845 [Cyanobacteriota bacterium]|nr:hypothetical protein [Cyanobacteriota bacterium]
MTGDRKKQKLETINSLLSYHRTVENRSIQSKRAVRGTRDRALRHTLIQRGKRQARQFSWERTAKETLKAYRSIL